MTETLTGASYLGIIKLILDMGVVGLVVVMAWLWRQQIDKTLEKWREDNSSWKDTTSDLMRTYREDTVTLGKMYENNVELVKRYEETARDMKDVIVLVSQNLQRLNDKISKEC